MDITAGKKYFASILGKRFLLRFHMSLILAGAALTGLIASKILLVVNIDNIAIRYPLAVIVSYGAFFGFMRLWLIYVITTGEQNSDNVDDAISDTCNTIPDFVETGESIQSRGTFSGGRGGLSGGGGASGSFENGTTCSNITAQEALIDSAQGAGKAVDDVSGKAISGISEAEEAGVILVLLGLLLAVVFGGGLYIVYNAPLILSEAAFDFVLAAGLIKSAKKIDNPDWKGSVFRTTWKPFVIILLLVFLGAIIIHINYPDFHRVSEIFKK